MKTYKNILLISGAGRNVGKTELACSLISRFSESLNVVAVKISPHFHDEQNRDKIIYKDNGLMIWNEDDTSGKKDSSRMLIAGAKKAFFVQSTDEYLIQALEIIFKSINSTVPLIVESGGLGRFIKPGISIYVTDELNKKTLKNAELRDRSDIVTGINQDSFDLSRIHFTDNCWKIIES